MKTIKIGSDPDHSVTIGPDAPLAVIAGPCVIESRDLCLRIAERLKAIAQKLAIGYIFKASFDKANRTSISSFRGPGLQEGLAILDEIRQQLDLPVCCDIHLPEQAATAAQVLDILQIPAFLARQTDLVTAAAKTRKCVQVKKPQFLAPQDMKNVVKKITDSGNDQITLVERGSSFGYNRLIADMTAIPQMQHIGYPVLMDATHATQQPGGLGTASGGSPEYAGLLARSAVAAGADGLFLETHPHPDKALSDAASMLKLDDIEPLLTLCRDFYDRLRP